METRHFAIFAVQCDPESLWLAVEYLCVQQVECSSAYCATPCCANAQCLEEPTQHELCLLCRIQEEHYKDVIPAGRLARFHKPLQTPEQRRAADASAAHAHFARMGWSPAEVAAGQVDRQLDALIARAHAMQEHAKRLENLAPPSRSFQHPPTFTCESVPYSRKTA